MQKDIATAQQVSAIPQKITKDAKMIYMPHKPAPSIAETEKAIALAAANHAEYMRKIGNYQPRFSQPGRSK
jgi:hypothetical protein